MNIQQTILEGIKQQLFFNSYLVFPGFGGFVLKSRPAHFSAAGGVLMPASKTVSFNAQLKQNDGLLATWLQAKLGCTPAEALTHLTEFAGFCQSVLTTKRRLSLEGIGFFYLDFENNICFEPRADVNFMTDSFGLSPVSVKELAPEPQVLKREPVFEDRTPASIQPATNAPVKISAQKLRRMVLPLALALLVTGLAALIVSSAAIKGDLRAALMGSGSQKTFEPLNYPQLNLLQSQAAENTFVADANGVATLELESGKALAVKVLEEVKPTAAPITPTRRPRSQAGAGKGNFEIVLGCFSVIENADRMVNKLSAANVMAFVSANNHKGMHVVSLGNFSTREQALEKLLEIKQAFPHAWIKKP